MVRRLLQRFRPPSQHRHVYEQIVAQARQPVFYAHLGVPDSVDGRFDMIVVHLVVALRRLRRDGATGRGLSQDLVDTFFKDMEYSLREMGVSDVAIPRRMKQVVNAFYGRAAAYEKALGADDRDALAAALRRNLLVGETGAGGAAALARYVRDCETLMAGRSVQQLLAGELVWASIAAEQPTALEL